MKVEYQLIGNGLDGGLMDLVSDSARENLMRDWDRRLQRELAYAFGVPPELLNTSNAVAPSGPTLTVDSILESIRSMVALPPPPPRVRMFESEMAGERVRVRTYPRRRAKSFSHWRRMDKKWLKRYGFRMNPTAYQMEVDGELLLVVHPMLADEYRRALPSERGFPSL